jgi:hypothetical protein
VLGLLLVARAASAQESAAPAVAAAASTTTWEVGGKTSYLSPPINGGLNPFGVGLGGRLGVSIGALYIGATVVDYFGGTDGDLTAHAITYGGEGGYTFQLGNGFNLRPSLGIGGITALYTTPNTTSSSTTTTTPSRSGRTQSLQVVDVITTASTSAGRSSSSGGLFGSSDSNSTTTTTNGLYLQPGVTLMLASSWGFAAVKGSAMYVPSISDGVGGSENWLMWGIDGELGLRF